ncbi:hypothetical protein AC579_5806 [Pseudocercospora musae]|uniref:Uncharacterized protein n=1 Tax=Pseudocercospora musae TaxID=113226 RepID=A0A139IR66_9PEZI|nr:hypothetical protein AC579_5806 [Pseudocercospora musae]
MEACDVAVSNRVATSPAKSPSLITKFVDNPGTKTSWDQNGLTFLPLRGTIKPKSRGIAYDVYCKDEIFVKYLTLVKLLDVHRGSRSKSSRKCSTCSTTSYAWNLSNTLPGLQALTRLAVVGLLNFCKTFPGATSQVYSASSAAAWATKFTTDSIAIAEVATSTPDLHARSARQEMSSYVYSHNILIGGYAVVHFGNNISHHRSSMSGTAISTWGSTALCGLMVAYNVHKMNNLAENLDDMVRDKANEPQVVQPQTTPTYVSKPATRKFSGTSIATPPPRHPKHGSRELPDTASAFSEKAVDNTGAIVVSPNDFSRGKDNEQYNLETAWSRAISLEPRRRRDESTTYRSITPTLSYSQPHRIAPNPPTPGTTWTGAHGTNPPCRAHTSLIRSRAEAYRMMALRMTTDLVLVFQNWTVNTSHDRNFNWEIRSVSSIDALLGPLCSGLSNFLQEKAAGSTVFGRTPIASHTQQELSITNGLQSGSSAMHLLKCCLF